MTEAASSLALRFAAGLELFLAPARRGRAVDVGLDGVSTLGHLVEATGVPLPEVGGLRVDGAPVEAGWIPRAGADTGCVVDVEAVVRPQPLPPGPVAFLLDVHLGKLARRMRLVGLDVAYRNDADDAQLADRSQREQRVLLSQDRGLLMRRAVWFAAYVRGTRADAQLADVLDRFRPTLHPWTRCTACNGVLAPAAKADVEDRLEPGTRRTQDEFWRCPDCGRVYWPGAHAPGLRHTVDEARRLVQVPRTGHEGDDPDPSPEESP